MKIVFSQNRAALATEIIDAKDDFLSKKITEKPSSKPIEIVTKASISIGAAHTTFQCLLGALNNSDYFRKNFSVNFKAPDKTFCRNMTAMLRAPGSYNHIVFWAPMEEELIFRLLIQKVFLKTIPKAFAQNVLKINTSYFDSKKYMYTRILISSVLFSAAHLTNLKKLGPSYTFLQVVATFFGGCLFGRVAESNFGLAGSTILHSLMNASAINNMRVSC